MTLLWIVALAALAYAMGMWVFLAAIVILMTIGYQICSLLHLVTEHAWVPRTDLERVRESHVKNSHGRWCGRMLPAKGLSGVTWIFASSTWWIEHVVIHLPARLLIVRGSLIAHDWHRRSGADRQWPNAVRKPETEVREELQGNVCTYAGVWRIHNCLHHVLQRISDAPVPMTVKGLTYLLN
ncbi:protein of unknown function [Burkholderia multivorans]